MEKAGQPVATEASDVGRLPGLAGPSLSWQYPGRQDGTPRVAGPVAS